MSAPLSARPQHLAALEWANTVRLARVKVRRQIAAGELSVADALDHWACETARVEDVLMAQRRWGRARAKRTLVAVGVREGKLVGTLSARQRDALIARVVAAGGGS